MSQLEQQEDQLLLRYLYLYLLSPQEMIITKDLALPPHRQHEKVGFDD